MYQFGKSQSPPAATPSPTSSRLSLSAASVSTPPQSMPSTRYDKAQAEIAKFQMGVKQLTLEPDVLSNTISQMYVSLRELFGTSEADEFVKKLKQPAILLLLPAQKNPKEQDASPSSKKDKEAPTGPSTLSRKNSLIGSIKHLASPKHDSTASKEKRNSVAEEDITTRNLVSTDPFFEPIMQTIQAIRVMQQRIGSLKNQANSYSNLLQNCAFLLSHYESFISSVCSTSGPQRAKFLEPRPEIKGVGIGFHFLSYDTACAIVSVNPNTGKNERFNEWGGGRTNQVGTSFFKPQIQCAGHEFKVTCDNNVSPGPESPQVTCVKVTLIPKGKKLPEEYFVIASHAVQGRNLMNIINNEPHLIRRIVPKNYSAHFTGANRGNPADHKADNFQVKIVGGDEQNPTALELVCVDNADGSMPPFCEIPSENHKHLVRGKNFLYLMPQMDEPIDPDFCAEFTAELPEVRLIHWLREMEEKNREFQTYINLGIFTQQQLAEQNLPIKLQPDTVANRYFIDCILYELLKNPHAGLTHDFVFNTINEELATCYRIIRQRYTNKLKEAVIPLNKESFYAEDLLADPNNTKYKELLEKIKSKYRQGFYANFENLTQTIPEAMEQCVRLIQFGKRTPEQQKTILQSLCDLENLSHLEFNDCAELDNEWLRRLTVRHRNLQSVSLSGKSKVTKEGLFALINTRSNISISLNINTQFTLQDWQEVCNCATNFNLILPNLSPDAKTPSVIPVKPIPSQAKQMEALGNAAMCGDARVLHFLLQNGYRKEGATNNRKRNLFQQAITSPTTLRSMEVLSYLLNGETADNTQKLIQSTDLDNNTSLHLACQEGWLEAIDMLLGNNASLLARNNQGQTPLHKLIEYKHIDILKKLFERFPTLKTIFLAARDESGRTLIHQAALAGDIEALRYLLSVGADVNQRDHHGDTPLHLAISSRHPSSVIQLLLDNNANTTVKNCTFTPPNTRLPGRDVYQFAQHLKANRDNTVFEPLQKKYEEQKQSNKIDSFAELPKITERLPKELQESFKTKSLLMIPLPTTDNTVPLSNFLDYINNILKEYSQNEFALLHLLTAMIPYCSQLSCLPISSELATQLLVTVLSQPKCNHTPLLELLVRSGATLTNISKVKSALHVLCKNPTAPAIEVYDSLLCCSQLSPNQADNDGNTPLFLIFGWADEYPTLAIEVMNRFKMQGADFKKLDAAGRNLVHKITQLPKASPQLLDALFAIEKFDLSLCDSAGNTPLYNVLDWCDSSKIPDSDGAILARAKTILQKLQQHGGSIEASNNLTKETLLDTAMRRGKPRTFGMLVECGAGKQANLEQLKKFLASYEQKDEWKLSVIEWRKALSRYHPVLGANLADRHGPTFLPASPKSASSSLHHNHGTTTAAVLSQQRSLVPSSQPLATPSYPPKPAAKATPPATLGPPSNSTQPPSP